MDAFFTNPLSEHIRYYNRGIIKPKKNKSKRRHPRDEIKTGHEREENNANEYTGANPEDKEDGANEAYLAAAAAADEPASVSRPS